MKEVGKVEDNSKEWTKKLLESRAAGQKQKKTPSESGVSRSRSNSKDSHRTGNSHRTGKKGFRLPNPPNSLRFWFLVAIVAFLISLTLSVGGVFNPLSIFFGIITLPLVIIFLVVKFFLTSLVGFLTLISVLVVVATIATRKYHDRKKPLKIKQIWGYTDKLITHILPIQFWKAWTWFFEAIEFIITMLVYVIFWPFWWNTKVFGIRLPIMCIIFIIMIGLTSTLHWVLGLATLLLCFVASVAIAWKIYKSY